MNLTVKKQDSQFVQSNDDFDHYALTYSRTLSAIKEEDSSDDLVYYVKISSKGKSIFRKLRAYNGINSTELAISCRSMKELAVGDGETVDVEKCSMLSYYWNNSDCSKKWIFRITVMGFVLTVISSIISLLSVFIAFPICCCH